jgi:branched-chain amino acid aminotransferase
MLRQALNRTSRAFSSLDASKLKIERCATPTKPPANDALVGQWGRVFSPHMLRVDWTATDGWSTPRIQPHAPLQLSPAAMTLHYALQCFEGMKAYRGDDDAIRLFRPDLNAKRMTSSLQRLAMPTFDETAFVELLKRFVEVEQDWVPRGEGHSMYLRPTCVATDPFLGVGVPQEATLYVIASPVGPYFPVRGRRPSSNCLLEGVEGHRFSSTTASRRWRAGAITTPSPRQYCKTLDATPRAGRLQAHHGRRRYC